MQKEQGSSLWTTSFSPSFLGGCCCCCRKEQSDVMMFDNWSCCFGPWLSYGHLYRKIPFMGYHSFILIFLNINSFNLTCMHLEFVLIPLEQNMVMLLIVMTLASSSRISTPCSHHCYQRCFHHHHWLMARESCIGMLTFPPLS